MTSSTLRTVPHAQLFRAGSTFAVASDEWLVAEFATSAAEVEATRPPCCERNALCVRGYRHMGKGGRCRLGPTAPPPQSPAAAAAAEEAGMPAPVDAERCCQLKSFCVRGHKHGGQGGPCKVRPPTLHSQPPPLAQALPVALPHVHRADIGSAHELLYKLVHQHLQSSNMPEEQLAGLRQQLQVTHRSLAFLFPAPGLAPIPPRPIHPRASHSSPPLPRDRFAAQWCATAMLAAAACSRAAIARSGPRAVGASRS